MATTHILINQTVLTRFAALVAKGRLAHAYLWMGPENVGKGETALAVAKLLNCAQGLQDSLFCDRCPSCVKINRRSHPDVHWIDNDNGESIKIEQIRQLVCAMQLKPYEAQKKIFIIRNVENLTLEGSNALLKTLEEPTLSSLLLLTTVAPEKILDTVRSRCHAVYFSPLSNRKLVSSLITDYAMEENSARFLAHFSQGCLGKAQEMHADKMIQKKNEIIDQVLYTPHSEPYFKKVLSDKIQTKQMLDVLLSWARDLILVKRGLEIQYLMHRDRIDDLRTFQKNLSFEELTNFYGEIIKTMKLFLDGFNIKMSLLLIKERVWERSYK